MKRILVVEDDDVLREALMFDCVRHGYEAQGCSSGNEALERLGRERFDLALSDWRMPDGDGECLLRGLESLSAAPGVILISGLDDLALDAAALRRVLAVFPKPFDRKELFKAIEKALNSRPPAP
jgi:DNA-binding response OmpR family regulator